MYPSTHYSHIASIKYHIEERHPHPAAQPIHLPCLQTTTSRQAPQSQHLNNPNCLCSALPPSVPQRFSIAERNQVPGSRPSHPDGVHALDRTVHTHTHTPARAPQAECVSVCESADKCSKSTDSRAGRKSLASCKRARWCGVDARWVSTDRTVGWTDVYGARCVTCGFPLPPSPTVCCPQIVLLTFDSRNSLTWR